MATNRNNNSSHKRTDSSSVRTSTSNSSDNEDHEGYALQQQYENDLNIKKPMSTHPVDTAQPNPVLTQKDDTILTRIPPPPHASAASTDTTTIQWLRQTIPRFPSSRTVVCETKKFPQRVVRAARQSLLQTRRRPGQQQDIATSRTTDDTYYWWDHPTVLAMVGCSVTAVLTQRATFLYGMLVAALGQVLWIVLRWILYLANDDELRNAQRVVQAALGRLGQEWNRIQHNENPVAVVWVAAMAAQWPTGMGFAVVQYRRFAHRANVVAIQEMERTIQYYHQTHLDRQQENT